MQHLHAAGMAADATRTMWLHAQTAPPTPTPHTPLSQVKANERTKALGLSKLLLTWFKRARAQQMEAEDKLRQMGVDPASVTPASHPSPAQAASAAIGAGGTQGSNQEEGVSLSTRQERTALEKQLALFRSASSKLNRSAHIASRHELPQLNQQAAQAKAKVEKSMQKLAIEGMTLDDVLRGSQPLPWLPPYLYISPKEKAAQQLLRAKEEQGHIVSEATAAVAYHAFTLNQCCRQMARTEGIMAFLQANRRAPSLEVSKR